MGVLPQVCREFNQILETTPTLWRFVEMDQEIPGRSAFKIIKTFAERSNHTLVSVKTREEFSKEEWKQVMPLLERSKATLRRLDIVSQEPEREPSSNLPPSIRFFKSFPNLERLNLTSASLPETERLPSVLTMLGCYYFFGSSPWSQDELNKISSLQTLAVSGQTGWRSFGYDEEEEEEEEEQVDDLHVMTDVFKACSQTLTHLSIETGMNGPHELNPIHYSLPKLTNLRLSGDTNFSDLLNCSLSHLVALQVSTTAIKHLGLFNNLRNLTLFLEFDYAEPDLHFNQHAEDVKEVIQFCSKHASTLNWIQFSQFASEPTFDIDEVLKNLDLDSDSTVHYPSLTDLYFSKDQIYSPQLLAQVVFSRNFEARKSLKDGNRTCLELTVHLHPAHIDDFCDAEEKVISDFIEKTIEMAGRTTVEEWE